jgi:DNA-binding MarR family transcriptional regulator
VRHEHSTDSGDPDESLSEAFFGVARALRRLTTSTLEPWEVNPSHSRALRELDQHGVMRPSELSEHLRIAPRSATEVIDALEERGLVERRPDPNDRRATLVTLTESGRSTSTAIRAARTQEAERFFGDLTPTERSQLAAILRKLRVATNG